MMNLQMLKQMRRRTKGMLVVMMLVEFWIRRNRLKISKSKTISNCHQIHHSPQSLCLKVKKVLTIKAKHQSNKMKVKEMIKKIRVSILRKMSLLMKQRKSKILHLSSNRMKIVPLKHRIVISLQKSMKRLSVSLESLRAAKLPSSGTIHTGR